jgi:hypothetical protein
MNRKNVSGVVKCLIIFLSMSGLMGCYIHRATGFTHSGDIDNFENWHIDVDVVGYSGRSDVEPRRPNEFSLAVFASTYMKDKWGTAVRPRPSQYEAEIKGLRLFLGNSTENEALKYEWHKEKRSSRSTFWSPIGGHINIPPHINELTIVTEVEFFSGESEVIKKEFVTKVKRFDEKKLWFDGI